MLRARGISDSPERFFFSRISTIKPKRAEETNFNDSLDMFWSVFSQGDERENALLAARPFQRRTSGVEVNIPIMRSCTRYFFDIF